MRLLRTIGAAAGAVGLATVADRALGAYAGDLEPPLGGRRGTFRWRGMDVAYTEAGDSSAPTVVCLHGVNAAGSSGEYREIWDALADDYHVVAPDFPGFGCSDRPPIDYDGDLYTEFVAAFLDRYDDPAVLAASLAGGYVANALARGEIDPRALVLVCPSTGAMPGPNPWARRVVRAPLLGDLLVDAATARYSIRRSNADHGYYDVENADDAWLDYQWRSAHQRGAKHAVAAFVGGYLNVDVDLEAALGAYDGPLTLVWGSAAETTTPAEGRELADAAGADFVEIDRTALVPHAERPEEFLDVVDGCFDAA
ncbi:pimeloyl-ACP methyl ester carboxylesterase [Halarchaeum rubridurum]|uniref:Alpha/beta hydrolase n=1 Tax=Halarchaeum rubridurum TaxID=489911 RepID=A0A830FYX5_9EURY|nr:alpha/beta hydrolase [Halarchaeum rubridurum]MBP1954630.1 pimeloyl-ACP methyl ester carboxylesterase [Halarchaeum rubridurum]GGM62609.1 alpha/beta hydrolase [Halarchaeum rubridurum]